MRQAWFVGLLSLGLLVSAWVSPQAAAAELADTIRPGTVTGGTLTVNGKAAELKYVYVKQGPSLREGTAFVVVLSDAPIAEGTLREEWGLEAPAAEGKLHAVELTFSQELQPRWGRAYHDAFSSASVSAYPSLHFVPSSYDGQTLSGRVFAEMGSSDKDPWECTATFSIVLDPGGKAEAAPAAAAPAPGSGTTTGTLTVGGKTAQLRYAYAHFKGEDKLVVVLSDVPLEESSWRGGQGLVEQASAGKAHLIWAEFNDVLKPNFAATYYDNSAGSAPYRFVPSLYDGKTLAGKLYSDTEGEYTATFSVPIHPKPEAAPETAAGQASVPAADLPEPEVDWNALSEQQKGPTRLAVEILQAYRKKDKAALKKLFMTEEEPGKMDEPLADLVLELASAAFSVPIKVTQVVMERDDKAEVHFQIEGRPDPGKVKAVLVNGEWRGVQ